MELSRRDALRRIALGGAAASSASLWFEALAEAAAQHAAHARPAKAVAAWTPKVLSPEQNKAVIALAELIIPRTDTPGATDAHVNQIIDQSLVAASDADRQRFLDGLTWMDQRTRRDHGTALADTPAAQQVALLTTISRTESSPENQPGVEFFQALKAMTVSAYYNTEIAMREEIGDDLQMVFTEFPGCTHPEHLS
jgi:glucoside 3-dehydrogenase (cytochrome c) hitch-hiker subunit